MSALAKRPATYEDLQQVPPNIVAELIFGALVTHPRPSPRHAAASSALGVELGGPFQKGSGGGPGGWIFLDEPELHFGAHVIVPDLAAWRRERLPRLPETAWLETPPVWVCEVLSDATERYDRVEKRQIYAQAEVAHLWLLDPRVPVLEIFTLAAGQWRLDGAISGTDEVSAPPFEQHRFSLSHLWPFDAPPEPETE